MPNNLYMLFLSHRNQYGWHHSQTRRVLRLLYVYEYGPAYIVMETGITF